MDSPAPHSTNSQILASAVGLAGGLAGYMHAINEALAFVSSILGAIIGTVTLAGMIRMRMRGSGQKSTGVSQTIDSAR